MKKIIFNDKNVKLNVEAKDWEEAIRIGGNMLVKQGFAKPCYIDGIIDSIKKYGPYIVIADGFAIPHARPELGSLKIGFSLVTFKEPVLFDGADPVKVMICFSAIDNKSHLDILKMIVSFVERGIIEKISNVKSIEELINLKKENQI